MSVSKLSKLPKQTMPVQRPSTTTAVTGQSGGIEASGMMEILEDILSKR